MVGKTTKTQRKNNMEYSRIVLLIMFLLISACYQAAKEVNLTGTSGIENKLVNTEWKLSSFGPTGAESPVVEGTTVTLKFGSESRVNGNGGCNTYGGDYQVRDDNVTFSRIISTKKACLDSKVSQQEREYFDALTTAGKFKITDNHLTISYDEGRGVLNFIKG
jgi:heat shock protein HslJ